LSTTYRSSRTFYGACRQLMVCRSALCETGQVISNAAGTSTSLAAVCTSDVNHRIAAMIPRSTHPKHTTHTQTKPSDNIQGIDLAPVHVRDGHRQQLQLRRKAPRVALDAAGVYTKLRSSDKQSRRARISWTARHLMPAGTAGHLENRHFWQVRFSRCP
jgi:hypothetical protein